MDQDTVFMRQALAQAQAAQIAGEVPVGAVLVRNGEVVAVGRNAPIAQHDATAHAEIVALRAAAQALGNYRLDDCTLYVTLEPCPMCAGAILHSRLKRVVYGATDPKTGAAGSVLDLFALTQLNHQTLVQGGLLADECATVLQTFFRERRLAQVRRAQPLRDDALRTPESAWPPQVDAGSHYVCDPEYTRGWRMHYREAGNPGATHTVLCLHDLPGSSASLQDLMGGLEAQGLRVLAPDLIGFGRSDKPKKAAAHTVSMHLDSLRGLLQELQPRGLVLLGVGHGADMASALARQLGYSLHIFRVPAPAATPLDMRAYPNRGFQAALLAVPGLLQALAHSHDKAPLPVTQLAGTASAMAEQLAWQLRGG